MIHKKESAIKGKFSIKFSKIFQANFIDTCTILTIGLNNYCGNLEVFFVVFLLPSLQPY